jgi:glycosyltransferase involved in cell wall biosynthesis
MKILHINGTAYGGAANFVVDLHNKLLEKEVESFIYFPKKRNIEKIIFPNSIFFKINSILKNIFTRIINRIIFRKNHTITLAFFKSYEIKKIIKKIKPDIIHLHWIGNEFLSLNEIKKINIPVVWTLHDMWVFLPVEHYISENTNDKQSFLIKISNVFSKFFLKKKRSLNTRTIKFIPTSKWMENKIFKSGLFEGNKIKRIPCGVDFDKWYPENKEQSKNILSLNKEKRIILFISMGGNNPRKGFDLLLTSLQNVDFEYELVIAGDQLPKKLNYKNIKFFDNPKDLITRRLLYSAADVLVAPSRTEAFGLVALEASACNTPSVIFDKTGLVDIIDHKKNGYIANSLDTNDYAKGINWVLNEAELNPSKFLNCRKIVQEKFHINLVAGCYLNVYQNLLKK